MSGKGTIAQRPYLLRAMHEWMVDNALTPHLVADAEADGLTIPPEHAKDGKIVLNISHAATRGLVLGNEEISFEARFNGVSRHLCIPVDAVLGIYARETGQGMIFSADDSEPKPEPEPPSGGDGGPRRPSLKIVR
jgi:stringent starvation protein B